MDKKVLQDYIDACELVKETMQDIKRLERKKKTIVQTNVKGSMHEFPYAEQHFHIEGTAFTYSDDGQLRMEERLLLERKEKAEKIKVSVQEFLNTAPARMQRIIRMKYFEGLNWEQVADKMGRNATGDSLRMELERFIQGN